MGGDGDMRRSSSIAVCIGLILSISVVNLLSEGADEPRADLTPHVEINSPLDRNLTGAFYYDNEPIFFDGRGSYDPAGGSLGYVWTFNRLEYPPVYDKDNFTRSFKEPGWYTITLNVSNSLYLTNETSVTILLVHKNRPPMHDIREQHTAIEDTPKRMDLSSNVWDYDNETSDLFLIVDSPYATADGLNLTVLFPEGVLEHDLWFNISDGLNQTEVKLHFTITPVDDPPEVSDLGEFTAIEDQLSIFNLTPFLYDVDTPVEQLGILVRERNCTVEGQELHFFHSLGGVTYTVAIEVADSLSRVTAELIVHVEEVNDPPAVEDIPRITIFEDWVETIDLSSFITDEDTPFDQLVLECTHPSVQDIEGLNLTMLYETWEDDHTVDFAVFDGIARTSGSFDVQVQEVNDPPVIEVILPRSLMEDRVETIDLSSYVSDEDTPLDQLVLECTHPSIQGIEGLILTMLYETWEDDHTVDFAVFDGIARTSGSFDVEVQAVNDPPEHDIPELQTATAGEPRTMDLASQVWDSDNVHSELSLNVDSPYATAEGLVLTVLFPEGLLEQDLWFNISDGVDSTEVKLHFTITPADHPPEISGLSIEDGQRVRDIISIEGDASDDGTVEMVQARIDGGEWVDVEGTDRWTHGLDTTSLSHGNHTLEIRGWDGNQWSDPVSVGFYVDQAPDVTIVTPEAMAKFKKTFEASGTASDDAGVIRVEVRIDEGNWMEVDGTQEWNVDIKVKDLEKGEHTLEVRAFDGEQYSDTGSVTFKVDDEGDSPSIGMAGAIAAIGILSFILWRRDRL
jgi:hypothetical protein